MFLWDNGHVVGKVDQATPKPPRHKPRQGNRSYGRQTVLKRGGKS